MKNLQIIFFILLVLFLFLNVYQFIINSNNIKEVPDISLIETKKNKVRVSPKVYYLKGDKLIYEVKNQILLEPKDYIKIFNAYKLPYSNSKNIISNINFKIINIKKHSGIIYINLKELPFSDKQDKNKYYLHIYSLVNTLTEFNNNLGVQILYKGQIIKEYKEIDLSRVFYRNDNIVLKKSEEAISKLESFFKKINEKKFKEAYKFIPLRYKLDLNIDEFKSIMKRYTKYHRNLLPKYYNENKTDSGYIIKVLYSKNIESENWFVLEEFNEFYIEFDKEYILRIIK